MDSHAALGEKDDNGWYMNKSQQKKLSNTLDTSLLLKELVSTSTSSDKERKALKKPNKTPTLT